jgi:hypothetical protein
MEIPTGSTYDGTFNKGKFNKQNKKTYLRSNSWGPGDVCTKYIVNELKDHRNYA